MWEWRETETVHHFAVLISSFIRTLVSNIFPCFSLVEKPQKVFSDQMDDTKLRQARISGAEGRLGYYPLVIVQSSVESVSRPQTLKYSPPSPRALPRMVASLHHYRLSAVWIILCHAHCHKLRH